MTALNNNNPGRGAKARRLPVLFTGLLALAAIMLAHFSMVSAQPVPGWSAVLGGSSDEFAHALALAGDGGYVIAGETRSFGSGSQDGWLVKLDAHGQEQWSRAYGGAERDVIYAVQKTADGGYILAGETHSAPLAIPASGEEQREGDPSQSDFWLIKTDADGMVEWERSFGNSEQSLTLASEETSDVAHSVRQTRDGGYVLAGNSSGSSGTGVWLLRTSSDGNLLWSRNPGVAADAVAHDVVQTADEGFTIAGSAVSVSRGSDAILIKTDSDGDTIWTRSFGGEYNDEARSLILTSDGGYALSGFSWSYGAGLSDFWLVKVNEEGRQEWERTFGGVARESAHSVVQTGDGGYVLAGWSESFSSGDRFWVVKTGPKGRQQWSRGYTQATATGAGIAARPAPAGARDIRQTEDQGFIITGWTGAIPGTRDILAIKTPPIEDWPAAPEGPVVTLRNTGGVSITSAAVGFGSSPSPTPLRFWHNGRIVDRDNPLPPRRTACSQPVSGLASGAELALDQVGSFESVYLNALSSQAEPPTAQIDEGGIEFDFDGKGTAIAGSFAVVSESPCDQSDRLLPEGPGAPSGLSVSASDTQPGVIMLEWEDSADADVSGYAVYIARNSSGPFTRLVWLLPDSGYMDIRTGDGATYYYAVSAVNSWGAESPKSAVAEVDSLDVTPPKPPTGLRLLSADRTAGRARLEWNVSSGDAIRGYRLHRQDGNEPITPITALLFGAGFEDWTLPAEGDFTYSVSAIDLAGNESGPSNIVPAPLDFFGSVWEVQNNFTGGGRLVVNTTRGRVDVDVAPDTEIRVPYRTGATLNDLDLGDHIAVALKQGGSTARQVYLVPSTTRNRHLAGVVISVAEHEIVIQPTDEDSERVALSLSDMVDVTLHGGVTGLAAGAYIIVSYTFADSESALVVSEINVIPGPERESQEEQQGTEEPGNVAVVRGVFQGINPENAKITLSFIEVSLNANTVMETGLSVGESVVVEALLLPDGSLLARRVGPDEGVGQIAARTVLRGVFQGISSPDDGAEAGQWKVSGETVLIDHRTYADSLPRAGQRVKVTAILQEDGSLRAREIENQPETEDPEAGHIVWLEGIFREITAGGAWDIGGVQVDVNADTALSGRPSVGQRVSVTAAYTLSLSNWEEALLATEVSGALSETGGAARSVRIRGIVEREIADGPSANAGVVVDGMRVTLSDLTKTLGDIKVGAIVDVKAEFQTDGSLIAREVSEVSPDDETGETRANPVDIEGRIEQVEADGSLLVNGIPVKVSSLTEIGAALQVGVPVQVRGLLQRDGSVLAREILGYGPGITAGTEASIEGLINEVATTADGTVSSFLIGGIPVTVDRLTRLEAEPTTGIAVAVQAIVIGGKILAVAVESQPIGNVGVLPKVQMQGIVENMPPGPVPLPLDITINGVTVRIYSGTQIVGALTGGAVVKVTGKVSGGVFLAEEIESLPAYDPKDGGTPAWFRIKGILQEARLDSEGRPDRLLLSGERIIVEALTVFQDDVSVGDSVTAEGVIRNGILLATLISLNESEGDT